MNRYIEGDLFYFDKDSYTYDGIKNKWADVGSINIYYRGDWFWFSKFKFYRKYKSYIRYCNLNYFTINGVSEKLIDKIVLNSDKIIYIKIRNFKDKALLFKVREFAMQNKVLTTEVDSIGAIFE
ncbi:MAG: hypothetical protein ABI315_08965 [Bacteroidia bacterium]